MVLDFLVSKNHEPAANLGNVHIMLSLQRTGIGKYKVSSLANMPIGGLWRHIPRRKMT